MELHEKTARILGSFLDFVRDVDPNYIQYALEFNINDLKRHRDALLQKARVKLDDYRIGPCLVAIENVIYEGEKLAERESFEKGLIILAHRIKTEIAFLLNLRKGGNDD